MTDATTARVECKHHAGHWCLSYPHDKPHAPHDPMPKKLRKARTSPQFRTAQLLALILEEQHDNPLDPGDVRLEQARRLLSLWNNAQGSLMGAFREILNLKMGHCVRCESLPCEVCGRKTEGLPV